ncbi:hypothetical protein QCA50_007214 [Cerrena zonata]|uniref:Uncharacterized protein n=1 Tax=Cerrena zonata TaxID=2478898 RepID=A0AAW0GAJ1_9APHY
MKRRRLVPPPQVLEKNTTPSSAEPPSVASMPPDIPYLGSEDVGIEMEIPVLTPSPPPDPIRVQSPPPTLSAAGQVVRPRRLPARYLDLPPEPLRVEESRHATEEASPPLPRVILIVRDMYSTIANRFGLWRLYPRRPSYDPDSLIDSDDLSDISQPSEGIAEPTQEVNNASPSPGFPSHPSYWPFENFSTSLLMNWMVSGKTEKSEREISRLVKDVLLHPKFRLAELMGFSVRRETKQLDSSLDPSSSAIPSSPTHSSPKQHGVLEASGFHETSVSIEVPTGEKNGSRAIDIPGLQHRKLTDVVEAAFSTDKHASRLHYSPHKLYHKSPLTHHDQRIYSELYNSDAFLAEDEEVKRHAPTDDPNCKLERVIAALMFWSDATHLANFGTAKLWPIYMILGNLSKYISALPDSGACHHIAYIPSLSDSCQDEVRKWHTKWKTQKGDILTHCRRELMHAVWKVLLDDEFIHAYKYGMVVKCPDGINRRIYPRIFTYSADYPEKVLLATIRDKGLCPCPQCLTPKSKLHLMGQANNLAFRVGTGIRKYLARSVTRARECIYKLGLGITSTAVNDLLKETSSVPTNNAFIQRLGEDFNLHRMLTVDFMHEYNLGVWKAVFIHLIRLLYAQRDGVEKVAELDRRYRHTPSFSHDTIRRFANNASEMKKLGARDFEDLLLCAVPAFEGLFDNSEDDKLVQRLLFKMAEWHAFAKLRMHTDETVTRLEKLTTELGILMRKFSTATCSRTETFELPREKAARECRQAEQNKTSNGTSAPTGKKRKGLNLNTYKWHALGHYVRFIRLFGPTDIYSTQIGEVAHRLVKRIYRLSSKLNATKQVAKRYMRVAFTRQNATDLQDVRTQKPNQNRQVLPIGRDPTGYVPPDQHHFISPSRNSPIKLTEFLLQGRDDPALGE